MKYSAKLIGEICKLVAAGQHSIADVCKQVGISEDTFYEWKKTKSEFSEALKKAEERRLAVFKDLARSGLAKRLDVYEYEEVSTEYVDSKSADGKSTPKIKGRTVTKKRVMPSDTLIIFTLKNTDPENWKDKKEVELNGSVVNWHEERTYEADEKADERA